ncbi:MAG: DUF2442 domain-containing protein [Bacteroidota bacterium]
MLPRITSVEAEPQTHTVVATFETGERRRYDVSPLLGRGVFRLIQPPEALAAVEMDEMGGLVWETGPDLSRDTIYLAGQPT